jgi:hypothetical protein
MLDGLTENTCWTRRELTTRSIDQRDAPERGLQVKQMERSYENAQTVQAGIGAGTEDHDAATAVNAIRTVSDFPHDKLSILT